MPAAHSTTAAAIGGTGPSDVSSATTAACGDVSAAAHCGCVVAGVVAGVVATARCGVREAMFIPFIGHECPIRGWPHAWQRLPSGRSP